jgi:hypothetical protein
LVPKIALMIFPKMLIVGSLGMEGLNGLFVPPSLRRNDGGMTNVSFAPRRPFTEA